MLEYPNEVLTLFDEDVRSERLHTVESVASRRDCDLFRKIGVLAIIPPSACSP